VRFSAITFEYRDLFKTDGTHIIEHGYYVFAEPKLAALVGERDWAEVLTKFSREELLDTGGVTEEPVLNLDCSPRIDDDGNPVTILKPIVQKINLSISLWDLQNGLKELSPRKRQAFFYNVILDKKQKEVAEIMEITTVSVGQYVEQAMLQLSERYFAEESISDLESVV
jgi:DNA-directed RNA polymerase specialized sigma24 family protein